QHEIERYNQLIEDFTDSSIFKPKLHASEADITSVKHLTEKPFICIAPASAWFTKQLPAEKWINLIQHLSPDQNIYLLGGPSDKDLGENIRAGAKVTNISNLCGTISFLQTYALMSKAQMNYVNDSAPLHLASASNAPVTAYFLSTVPLFGFGPLSDNSTVKEVRTLNCRPCGIHGFKTCPQGHFKCGHDMQV
ncbi:MAG: glycosyltransferase family 9 protein, partial [Bacteroidota bacterium]